jgi:hypothetical protein
MRIDSCRDDLPPQSAPPVRCEIDERVDTTELVPVAKPKDTKCIVTSFCPRCGEMLTCVERQGPMPKQCEYCLTNTPKPHVEFGKAVKS